MSTTIRFKRGTQTAVEAYSQLAEVGEPIFDIERKRLFIGTDTTIEEIGGDHFSVEDDTLDDINDGTTYGKVANLDLTSNRVDFDKLINVDTTLAELNQLNTSGCVLADFVKLHALTASAAEINYLDNSNLTSTMVDFLTATNLEKADFTKLADITASAAEINYLDNSNLTSTMVDFLTATNLEKADFTKLADITASAAEINYLDNSDLTAADLQKLADITASAAEINYLDNSDLTAADLQKLADITASAAELNQLDDVSVGGNTSGDIITTDNTQTLTNKTFTDSTTYFQDEGDNTRKLQLQLSGITTGNTRTLTIPDSSGTIQLVGGAPAAHVHAGTDITSGLVGAGYIADLSATYAVVALGVTNGNTHDHSGGDGAQISHLTLSNIGSNSHATIDSHISATAAHGATGAVVGTTNGQTLTNKSISGEQINSGTVAAARIADLSATYSVVAHSHAFSAITGDLNVSTQVTGTFSAGQAFTRYIEIDSGTSLPSSPTGGELGVYYGELYFYESSTRMDVLIKNASTSLLTEGFNVSGNITINSHTSAHPSLICVGNNDTSDAGKIRLDGSSYDTNISANGTGSEVRMIPSTTNAVTLSVGTGSLLYYGVGIYSQGNTNLYIGASNGLNIDSTGIKPISSSETDDLGSSANGWDVVYRVSESAPAEMYFMDSRKNLETGEIEGIDDLEIIDSIKPRKDKKGEPVFDKRTGYMLTDDDTLPKWIFTRNKENGEIERNEKGQPFYYIDAMTQLCVGSIRKLYNKYKDSLELIDRLEDRIKVLELK